MAEGSTFRLVRENSAALWMSVCGLLVLGMLTTVIDLAKLPMQEAATANANRQRFVVNPGTGEVSLGTDDVAEGEKFDVGSKAETPAPAPAEAAPAPAEAPPTTVEPSEEEAPAPGSMPSLRTQPLTVDMGAPPRGKDSLVAAPAPEVTETVDGMQLPKRGAKNVLPSKLYAHPFVRRPEQVLISFVVTDVGLDAQSIGLLLSMPKEVSVAYTPYVRKDATYSEHLRALGHEVWTMLPTMNDRYPSDDPGPMGLLGRMPGEELVRRVREVLAVVPGSVGLILPPDENITVQKNVLVPVLKEIDARGLLMVTTHPTHSIDQITTDTELTGILQRADLVLDPEPDEAQIRSKLAGLLEAAKEKSDYLVVVSSRPQTLKILSDWLRETKLEEPYALAPLTALYQATEAPKAAEGAGEGHGSGEKKEKPKPKAKKVKMLPQDKYKQGAAAGGHGGGEKKAEGH